METAAGKNTTSKKTEPKAVTFSKTVRYGGEGTGSHIPPSLKSKWEGQSKKRSFQEVEAPPALPKSRWDDSAETTAPETSISASTSPAAVVPEKKPKVFRGSSFEDWEISSGEDEPSKKGAGSNPKSVRDIVSNFTVESLKNILAAAKGETSRSSTEKRKSRKPRSVKDLEGVTFDRRGTPK